MGRFGRNARHWRIVKGLTMAEAAKALGTSYANLSRLETGQVHVRLSMVLAMARVYAVPAAVLIASPENMEN